jgi:hypothetical protein
MAKKTTSSGEEASLGLSRYDGRRFVFFSGDLAADEPLQGTAHFEHHSQLGNILRITLDGPLSGNPYVIITESTWKGLILQDNGYGCDFCLLLAKGRVSRDVLEQTTRCSHGFRCQMAEGKPLCPVTRVVGGRVLCANIDQDPKRPCSYFAAHNGDHFCTCPTRIEMHRKYQV